MITHIKTSRLRHQLPVIISLVVVGFAFVTGGQASDRAPPVKVSDLKIEKTWSRATPKTAKVGVGYLRIENAGTTADRLIRVETPIAGHTSIHEMTMSNSIMKMRKLVHGLEIPAGESVVLKPGGSHIMFMNLGEPIRKGEPFNAMLTFEKAGTVEVEFVTVGIGGSPAQAGHED